MIKVGRRTTTRSIYIGRPSPLGNPYSMKDKSIEERNRVCALYQKWFDDKVVNKDPEVMLALELIPNDAVLGCYCSPLRCHGDTIKKYIDEKSSLHYLLKD